MEASSWKCVLELSRDREIQSGSEKMLADAVGRGADLRTYTEFYFEEHVAPFQGMEAAEDEKGLVREVMDFRQVYLEQGQHVAGLASPRQPMNPVIGFNGTQPRLSMFVYNMTGHQSCGGLVLDDQVETMTPGCNVMEAAPDAIPKMSASECLDVGTSGGSSNFIYDMEKYRFIVRDDWTLLLSHDENGNVIEGSWEALAGAQQSGKEFKVGIRNLCGDLGDAIDHEVFTPVGAGFNHLKRRVYEVQTFPLVRIAPCIPLKYSSRGWDMSWLMIGTNGHAFCRTLDPYTRKFRDWEQNYACRWFCR